MDAEVVLIRFASDETTEGNNANKSDKSGENTVSNASDDSGDAIQGRYKQVEWFNVNEAVFYGLAWAVAFLSSLFVTIGSSDLESTRKCFSIGGVSGFLAFSVVSVLCGRVSEPLSGQWYYLGVASLIGLCANQQESIRQRILEVVLQRSVSQGKRD